MNNNQFYSENHYSNIRNNKFPSNLDQQAQMNQYFASQLTPLHPPSTYHLDNEIDAFHGSHKCHWDSMDVSDLVLHFDLISTLNCFHCFVLHILPVPISSTISQQQSTINY